ncbi:hypothetical protein O3P69_012294 [Scylla paramamosain]|uniref:DUF4209 domain-containing protein n=1 Tax=Scylla paramamosain TaxID=85552 RepID=A0AAW0TCG1_SCYPA
MCGRKQPMSCKGSEANKSCHISLSVLVILYMLLVVVVVMVPYGKIEWQKIEEVLAGVAGQVWSEGWYRGTVEALAPLLPQCQAFVVDGDPLPALLPHLAWMAQEEAVLQCLGELVLMCGGQVPFLLRDLLDTPELLGVMGATWVKVAKVLVGSVLGLNMRNLAWHGFLNPEETQAGPVCALLLLLAECGRVLEEQGGNEAVPRKPSMCLSLKEGVGVEVEEGEVWPSRAVVEEVVETSGLVPLVMKPVWRRALDHLLEGRHWVGLALLLPQLECSLRCLFAWANEVPSRVLTAQHTALYTTLDHALAAHVTGGGAGGAEGREITEALFDLLNFSQGPRVRDRVLRKWISGYRSHYHPTSLLHAALLSSTSLLAGWKEWKRVERSEIDYVEWEKQVEVLVEEMDRLYERVEEEKGKSNVELEVGDRKGNKGRTDKEVDTVFNLSPRCTQSQVLIRARYTTTMSRWN